MIFSVNPARINRKRKLELVNKENRFSSSFWLSLKRHQTYYWGLALDNTLIRNKGS